MNGIDTMRTRLDDHLECSRCKRPVAEADDFCPHCGSIFGPDSRCARHPECPAEGVCLICEKPYCGQCADFVKGTFLCARHATYDLVDAVAQVVDPLDDATALDVKSRLEQQGLHPHFLRSKGSGWDGLAVNSLRVMVPAREVEEAEKTLRLFGVSFVRTIADEETGRGSDERLRTEAPKGIGGWLLLLLFNLIVVGPMSILGSSVGYVLAERAKVRYFSTIVAAFDVFFTVECALALFGMVAGIALLGRWRNALRLARAFLWTSIGISIGFIAVAVVLSSFFRALNRVDPALWSEFIRAVIPGIVFAITWLMYLRHSQRVKNTYLLPQYL